MAELTFTDEQERELQWAIRSLVRWRDTPDDYPFVVGAVPIVLNALLVYRGELDLPAGMRSLDSIPPRTRFQQFLYRLKQIINFPAPTQEVEE